MDYVDKSDVEFLTVKFTLVMKENRFHSKLSNFQQ